MKVKHAKSDNFMKLDCCALLSPTIKVDFVYFGLLFKKPICLYQGLYYFYDIKNLRPIWTEQYESDKKKIGVTE